MLKPPSKAEKPARPSVFYCKEILLEGYFLKSPPSNHFSTQSSWKKRYFVLSKTHENAFYLEYFKGADQGNQLKGTVFLDKILKLCIGPEDHSKWNTMQKMFKCSPENVLFIGTKKRDYFLIGEDNGNIKAWFDSIFSAWKSMEIEGNPELQTEAVPSVKITEHSLLPDTRERPFSLPTTTNEKKEAHHRLSLKDVRDPVLEKIANKYRTYSEPCYDRHSHIYQHPRDFQRHSQDSSESEDDDEDHYLYMPMSAILRQIEKEREGDKEKEGQEEEELFTKEKDEKPPTTNKDNASLDNWPHSLSQKSEECDEDNMVEKIKDGAMNIVDLYKLHEDKILDESKLMKVDIFASREDLKDHLTLILVRDKLCVSHWNGIKCVFHYGDQITAINELRLLDIDDVSLYIERATKNEVKLTVLRQPDSKLWHSQKCTCDYK